LFSIFAAVENVILADIRIGMDEIGANPERFSRDISFAVNVCCFTEAIGIDQGSSPGVIRFHDFGFHKAATFVIRADLNHLLFNERPKLEKMKKQLSLL